MPRINKFGDVNEPRHVGCLRQEAYYPVHVAAMLGNDEVLRLLLRHGASTAQRTRRGHTALQLARQADENGSHAQVIGLLATQVRCLTARQLSDLL